MRAGQLRLFVSNEPRGASNHLGTCCPTDFAPESVCPSGPGTHARTQARARERRAAKLLQTRDAASVCVAVGAGDGVRGVRHRGGVRHFRLRRRGRVAHSAGGGADTHPGARGSAAQVKLAERGKVCEYSKEEESLPLL